jgi:hypothetical protein
MSTTTFSSIPKNTSNYIATWGAALSGALTTVGLINITSTITNSGAVGGVGGPANWAAVTTPGTPGTYPYFEVFRFNDTAQTTHPIFIKIEYGAGSSANNPALRITVGRSINLADGSFIGTTTTALPCVGSTAGTNPSNSYVSGSSGRCNVVLWAGVTTNGIAFYVERTKDDSGNTTDDAVTIITWMGGSAATYCQQQLLPKGAGGPNPSIVAGPQVPQTALPMSGNASWGANVGYFPIFPNMGFAANPDLGGCLHFNASTPSESTIALTMYGVAHTFIAAGLSNTSTSANNGNNTGVSIAMRYE